MKTLITLTRFPEIFNRLRLSVENYERYAKKIVITSGGCEVYAPGWEVIKGIEPFIFSRNANLALDRVRDDVLLINDDCELISPIMDKLGEIARANPNIGILSPQIEGIVGNRLQQVCKREELYYTSKRRLAFVCVYIPWRTLKAVGRMDERFTGYGCDDDDYCYRIKKLGLELGITGRVIVRHEGSATFKKEMGYWQNLSMVGMWLKLKIKQMMEN